MPPDTSQNPIQPQATPQASQTPQVDPTALALSRAIRQAEGGDYTNTSADNGTSAGAYSWNNYVDGKSQKLQPGQLPANFTSAAQQFGLNPNDFSQTNQDHVAYEQIKAQLDAGHSQSEVASWWNSGSYDSAGNKGYNSKLGVSYDTPAYVAKVQKYYAQETQGGGLPDASQAQANGNNAYNPTPFSNPLPGSFNFSGNAGTPPPQQNQPISLGGILSGGLNMLNAAEKPFIGLAAAPMQGLAKLLGQGDPYSHGIGEAANGNSITGQNIAAPAQVDPLANSAGGVAEQEAGNAAQVGSYFVPGGEGVLPTILGGTAMGVLQGAGSAMSQQKGLTDVATQGAEGGVLGGGTAGILSGAGSLLGKAGEGLTGEGTQKALQGLKDAYTSALNLNAGERGFESTSGRDLAQVLMDNGVSLGRNDANSTLDASEAIPVLQKKLSALNDQADPLVTAADAKGDLLSLPQVFDQVKQDIQGMGLSATETKAALASAQKQMDDEIELHGSHVQPSVAEDIKQGLQATAFRKGKIPADDAKTQSDVAYALSKRMRSGLEDIVGSTDSGSKYSEINAQRSDLVDAIKRLTKLDGTRLVKGGRLGGITGNIIGSIAGASSGLGPMGTLAGDYFGGEASKFLNNPATKIAIGRAKVGASGVLPKILGGASKPVGKALSGTGGVLSKFARPAGLMANIAANAQNSR